MGLRLSLSVSQVCARRGVASQWQGPRLESRYVFATEALKLTEGATVCYCSSCSITQLESPLS